MELKSKISLDLLTVNGVTVKTQQYIEINGEELSVGELHAKAYVNSERGRAEIVEEVEEPYLSAVLAVWGDTPVVVETPDLV